MSDGAGQNLRTVAAEADEFSAGDRLDVFLGEAIEDVTRSYAKRLIKDGQVCVGARLIRRPSYRVHEGDVVEVTLPPPPADVPRPEDIPLDILYEDADIVIVNKAAGMVVHPSPGHDSGTLVNAVAFHCRDFQLDALTDVEDNVIRPGIVHRLDRDTSGVLVVAKTPAAFIHLARQAREHTFERRYIALVRGEFPEDRGVIRASIGRSLSDRGRMAVTPVKSREAVTHFHVLERFGVASLVELRLETGRTHQIRVHLRFAGRPVLGDETYGITDFTEWGISLTLRRALEGLHGQALHAQLLGIEHPRTGERLRFEAPPPEDFQRALDALRRETASAQH